MIEDFCVYPDQQKEEPVCAERCSGKWRVINIDLQKWKELGVVESKQKRVSGPEEGRGSWRFGVKDLFFF